MWHVNLIHPLNHRHRCCHCFHCASGQDHPMLRRMGRLKKGRRITPHSTNVTERKDNETGEHK